MKRIMLAVVAASAILCLGLSVASCGRNGTEGTGTIPETLKESAGKNIDELTGQLEEQLTQYDRSIAELTAQARVVGGQTQQEIDKNVEMLKAQREDATKKLEELKSLKSTTFEDILRYAGLEEIYKKIASIRDLFR